MSLRTRVALILAALVVTALGLLLVAGGQVVDRGFGTLEQRQARDRAALGARQLDEERARISELALDYAAWDDMYDYVAHPAADFMERAVPPDWLPRVRLEMIAVVGSDGQPQFARSIIDNVTVRALPAGLMRHLQRGRPLVTLSSPSGDRTGLVVLSSGIWLIAARPITTSTRQGPVRGTFLVGRRVDDALLSRFSKSIGLPVRLEAPATDAVAIGGGFRMRADAVETMTAFVPLSDVYGHAVSWLAVAVPREVEAERRRTQYYLAGSLVLASVVFACAILAFLNRYIVRRMAQLAAFLRSVDDRRDFTSRLLDSRRDEIGQVATAVNDLLATIAHRNRELEVAKAQAVEALAEKARQNQALEAANRLIEQMARTDGLTGLPNRRMFDERLDQEISRARRERGPFALLLADIDRFKTINDRGGHAAGDRVLVHAASVFAANIRAHDIAARYGGEEFAVLLSNTSCTEAALAAERIRAGVEALDIPEYDGRVTISIGVVEWRPDESCESLAVRADRLLYEAKRRGRNQVRVQSRAPLFNIQPA